MNMQTKRPEIEMEQLLEPVAMSRVGLGTWAIGGWMWGGSDERESIRTIHAALDLGVTLIDTAPAYGFGRAEEIVGKALAQDGKRQRAVIATKVGLNWSNERLYRDSRPQRMVEEIESSLRRLRTDAIDVYQVHWPDALVPIEDTAETLARLYRAGKINAIGVSNFSPAEMELFRSPRRCTPRSRPTICSSGRSRRTCCRIAARRASRCWPTARSAAACCRDG